MKTLEQKMDALLMNPKTAERIRLITNTIEKMYEETIERKIVQKCHECGKEMRNGDTVYSNYVGTWPNGGEFRYYCTRCCAEKDAARNISETVLVFNSCGENQ